ncbi:MAG: hypothetical protein ACRELB_08520, partial [Polyangiaceae bacterium]
MSVSSPPPPDAPEPEGGLAWAILAGTALLVAGDAAGVVLGVPLPSSGWGTRLAAILFDAGEMLGIGALAAAAVALYARFVKLPRLAAFGIAMAVAMAVLNATVGDQLRRGIEVTFDGRYRTMGYVAYLAALGFAIPRAYTWVAAAAGRPVIVKAVLALGLAALAADHVALHDDYQGMHGVLACAAALLAGAAVAPWARRRGLQLAGSRRGRVLLGGLALGGAAGVLVAPPNAVRFELFREPCVVAPWVLSQTLW